MNEVIHNAFGVTITPWKLVGDLGVALFAGRWFVQMYYSRRLRRPVVPTAFWVMSISGSVLLLSIRSVLICVPLLFSLFLRGLCERLFTPRSTPP